MAAEGRTLSCPPPRLCEISPASSASSCPSLSSAGWNLSEAGSTSPRHRTPNEINSHSIGPLRTGHVASGRQPSAFVNTRWPESMATR